jgi:hypothetical protein
MVYLKPTPSGLIFLTYTYTKNVKLPGVTLCFLKGHGPIAGDNAFVGELYASQRERAFLENLQPSRRSGDNAKNLPLLAIEEKLDKMAAIHGEEELNRLRERARTIAAELGLVAEFERLNTLISALLGTNEKKRSSLQSSAARARAFGLPYDAERVALFEKLAVALRQSDFAKRPCNNADRKYYTTFAFFESYFSNYIEGTEFTVEEAHEIVETQEAMPARHEDSHDILGTYKIVGDPAQMSVRPETAAAFLELLRSRHATLMSARAAALPGHFKERNNRAGNTHFVEALLVRGTLTQGFDFYRALTQPFARAALMMFLVAEVHPFTDGNGRIARVMMNAELVAADETKIIIPTVYREDYLGALRRLTRQADPEPYIRMLERIHAFSATCTQNNFAAMREHLEACNAFRDPNEAPLRF